MSLAIFATKMGIALFIHFLFTNRILVPNVTTGIFIVVALAWGWLSDGPLKGRRWPFVYAGAVISVSHGVRKGYCILANTSSSTKAHFCCSASPNAPVRECQRANGGVLAG